MSAEPKSFPDVPYELKKIREIESVLKNQERLSPLLAGLGRQIVAYFTSRKEELLHDEIVHLRQGVETMIALLARCADGTSPSLARAAIDERTFLFAFDATLKRFLKRPDEGTLRELQEFITLFETKEALTEAEERRFLRDAR